MLQRRNEMCCCTVGVSGSIKDIIPTRVIDVMCHALCNST